MLVFYSVLVSPCAALGMAMNATAELSLALAKLL